MKNIKTFLVFRKGQIVTLCFPLKVGILELDWLFSTKYF